MPPPNKNPNYPQNPPPSTGYPNQGYPPYQGNPPNYNYPQPPPPPPPQQVQVHVIAPDIPMNHCIF